MLKLKHERTADCVVAGYRIHKSGPDRIGSLLLGLYKDDGNLASVGVIGAFIWSGARSCSPSCSRWSLPSTSIRGTGRSTRRASGPRGRPWPAGGTRTRTCRSSRCARSAWSRCATTTWRARVPAHRPVRPLAPGSRTALVHQRRAGGAGQLRPGGDPPRPFGESPWLSRSWCWSWRAARSRSAIRARCFSRGPGSPSWTWCGTTWPWRQGRWAGRAGGRWP